MYVKSYSKYKTYINQVQSSYYQVHSYCRVILVHSNCWLTFMKKGHKCHSGGHQTPKGGKYEDHFALAVAAWSHQLIEIFYEYLSVPWWSGVGEGIFRCISVVSMYLANMNFTLENLICSYEHISYCRITLADSFLRREVNISSYEDFSSEWIMSCTGSYILVGFTCCKLTIQLRGCYKLQHGERLLRTDPRMATDLAQHGLKPLGRGERL